MSLYCGWSFVYRLIVLVFGFSVCFVQVVFVFDDDDVIECFVFVFKEIV